MRFIIVGNSAAGIAAAETLRSLDKGSNQIILVSDEPEKAYTRCLLADLLAGKKTETALSLRPGDFYSKLNITLMSGQRVVQLDPLNKKVTLNNDDSLHYDRLLLATGARPAVPDLPGVCARGVFTLRSLADARGITARAGLVKHAVVLGGGLVGLKAAWGLKSAGLDKVTVLITSPRLLSRQLDRHAASLVEAELNKYGVDIVYNTGVKGFLQSTDGHLSGIETDDGSIIPAGLALIAKGVKPNTDLIDGSGGHTGHGIKVDRLLKTSLEDVFAAGDCIEVTDRLTGEKVNAALWTLAYEQGRYAAANMLGNKKKYPDPLTRLNSAKFGSVNIISVGCQEGPEIMSHYDRQHQTYRRLVFNKRRLIGFILAGKVEGAGLYTALVKSGRPVTLKDDLLLGRTGRIALSCLDSGKKMIF